MNIIFFQVLIPIDRLAEAVGCVDEEDCDEMLDDEKDHDSLTPLRSEKTSEGNLFSLGDGQGYTIGIGGNDTTIAEGCGVGGGVAVAVLSPAVSSSGSSGIMNLFGRLSFRRSQVYSPSGTTPPIVLRNSRLGCGLSDRLYLLQ